MGWRSSLVVCRNILADDYEVSNDEMGKDDKFGERLPLVSGGGDPHSSPTGVKRVEWNNVLTMKARRVTLI